MPTPVTAAEGPYGPLSVDSSGQPNGRKLREAHGIQERAYVGPDGAVSITRWTLKAGRWEIDRIFTVPATAAIALAEVLAEHVTAILGPLDHLDDARGRIGSTDLPVASCGHPLHARGSGCTHDGCANDSRQFAADDTLVTDVAGGGHKYADDGTSDCAFGCGAWAGPFRSGAPDGIDPLGKCPKNPAAR